MGKYGAGFGGPAAEVGERGVGFGERCGGFGERGNGFGERGAAVAGCFEPAAPSAGRSEAG
jgi:hypothetical protein